MGYIANQRLEVDAYQIIPQIVKAHAWSAKAYYWDVVEGREVKVFVTGECWGSTKEEADSNARKADILV
jgi:hypothetical protein